MTTNANTHVSKLAYDSAVLQRERMRYDETAEGAISEMQQVCRCRERMWHMSDCHGQILALAFRSKLFLSRSLVADGAIFETQQVGSLGFIQSQTPCKVSTPGSTHALHLSQS